MLAIFKREGMEDNMKKYLLSLLLILSIIGIPTFAAASDITNAIYQGNLIIVNTGTAAIGVSTNASIRSQAIIDNYNETDEFNKVAVRNSSNADVPFMPGYNTNPWCFYIPEIADEAILNYLFYVGSASLNSTKYYFPGATGMAVTDNSTIEPGADFEFNYDGYIDTTAGGGYIFNHSDTTNGGIYCEPSPSVSGNVVASVVTMGNNYPVNSTNTTGGGLALSFTVTAPSGISAGDLMLLYMVSYNGTPASTPGWTNIFDQNFTTNAHLLSYYLVANGTETSWTITQGGIYYYVYQCYRINAGTYTGVPVCGTAASGNSANPDPPSLTTGFGNVHTLFFAVEANPSQITTVAPANYNGLLDTTISIDIATASRQLTAVSDDPGTFTIAAARAWGANTVAIKGATINSASLASIGSGYHTLKAVVSAAAYSTEILRPNAAGDETNISNQEPNSTAHYDKVDDVAADDASTYVFSHTNDSTLYRDLYNLSTTSLTTETITKVTVYARMKNSGILTSHAKIGIKTGGTAYDSSEITLATSWTLYSQEWTINPKTGVAWVPADLNALQAGVSLEYSFSMTIPWGGSMQGQCTQVYISVEYVGGAGLTLEIDGLTNYNGSAAIVPDSTANWQIGDDTSTPYIKSVSLTISGVEQGLWNWEYGTTFTDLSGHNHTATPSFRTTSSDADVSASLTTFEPLEYSIPPAYAVDNPPSYITGNITIAGQFTTGNVSTTGGPPGFAMVSDLANAGEVPNIWLFGILALCLCIFSHLFWIWMQRRFSFRSLWPFFFTGVFIFGMFIALGGPIKIFDFWMIVFYIVIFICVMVMSRHTEVGGNASTHGVIGFAAQSWIGLTIINKMLESSFVGASETAWVNNFAFTQHFKIFNMFSIPVLNLDFWTKGIPSLFRWDYSFFGGNAQMFQYLLYSLTAVVAFIVFGIVIGMLYNFFTGR
jgi:hypothetical protein